MRRISFALMFVNFRSVAGFVGKSITRGSIVSRSRSSATARTLTAPIILRTATTAVRSTVSDDSAASKSRAPFRMPKNSADDSMTQPGSSGGLVWNKLGLVTELVNALNQLKLESPTPVQQLAIPELLKEPPEPITFLAATGSGKTLAYALPLLQQLKQTELFDGKDQSRPKRPRLLILVPTRELVRQITDVVKSLCHHIKLSSCAITGGEDYGIQRKRLNKPIDIVVATPGRLVKHWKDQNVFLGSLEHVVLDEMDTMLEQGFHRELRELLYPVLYGKRLEQTVDVEQDLKENAPRMVLTSATMTQQISKIIGDASKDGINAKRHYRKLEDRAEQQMALPPFKVLKAPGLHKTVPRLNQVFVDVGSTDKISLLVDIVASGGTGAAIASSKTREQALTMVFCNTAASCRAVQFALAEAQIETLAYHGELNSAMRTENLDKFRRTNDAHVLVCTDLAARGLDVPEVDHVVMFDFPLNSLDYLHRSGRTARGEGNGRVTALVSKRDKVLANAIERAVVQGDTLDGLSSRKSDYARGARLGNKPSGGRGGRGGRSGGRGRGGGRRR